MTDDIVERAKVEALRDEIERLRIWSSDSHVTELEAEVERLRAELERFYPAEDVELFSPHIERACQKPPTLTVWFRDEYPRQEG